MEHGKLPMITVDRTKTNEISVKGHLQLVPNGDEIADIRFFNKNNGYVAFKAPESIASNVTLTLPNVRGNKNQILRTDENGKLEWTSTTQGVRGTQGERGSQGPLGSQGTQGSTGLQGIQGNQGPPVSGGGVLPYEPYNLHTTLSVRNLNNKIIYEQFFAPTTGNYTQGIILIWLCLQLQLRQIMFGQEL